VEPNSGLQDFTLKVPSNGCGTEHVEFSRALSNIIIFQMDDTVQVRKGSRLIVYVT